MTPTRLTCALGALLLAPALANADGLLVFDYSGFEDPAFHSKYVETHGGSPEFAFFGDEDEALQKVRAGFTPDVAHLCAGSVTRWTDAGLVEAWDTSKIPAWGDLNKDLVGADVASGEEVFFVPTDFGSTAIIYNTDEVPAEDVASLQVFHNPAYAGRMTLPDNVDDAWALAYLATGVTAFADVGDAEFEAAAQWLRTAHENIRTYWVDPAELAQLMTTGETVVAWAWNETYPTLTEEEFPVGYARETEEGSSLWLCGLVKVASGKGDDALAYEYLNALLDPSSTEPLLDSGFGPANAAAMADVEAAALDAAGLGEIDVPVLAQLPIDNELRTKMTEEFERIKAGF